MSAENVKKFVEALEKDTGLQKAIEAKEKAYTGKDRVKAIGDIIVPFAKEKGLPFTAEEFTAFEVAQGADKALSAEELAGVTGGKFCLTTKGNPGSWCLARPHAGIK